MYSYQQLVTSNVSVSFCGQRKRRKLKFTSFVMLSYSLRQPVNVATSSSSIAATKSCHCKSILPNQSYIIIFGTHNDPERNNYAIKRENTVILALAYMNLKLIVHHSSSYVGQQAFAAYVPRKSFLWSVSSDFDYLSQFSKVLD